MKKCFACKIDKPLTDYGKNSRKPDGLMHTCKVCTLETKRKWRKNHKNPKYFTERNRKSRYGVSPDQYDKMFEAQEGRCAICGEEGSKSMAVDHDHKTGQVRGLLCRRCNIVLGLVKDVPTILEAAIQYLYKTNEGGL